MHIQLGGWRRFLTSWDIALALAILLAGLCSVYWAGRATALGAGTLRIEVEGRVVSEITFLASDPPRLVTVAAPRGEVTVELREGRARVLSLPESVCPVGICWHAGWTSTPAKIIVCLPNRLVVRIIAPPGKVDGITR